MAEYLYTSHPYKRRKNGKNKGRACSCPVHRKIWIEKYGDIPDNKIIHHINGNKFDNRIENLICITRQEHRLMHSPKNNNN